MALEINLVPDIKNEMIRTLKLRNLIFFLCIVVASASVAIVFIFGVIVGGQQIAINNKTTTLEEFSNKINSYSDLNEFITIKDQLENISSITSEKNMLSRTFNILSALNPTGPNTPDKIMLSELTINLEEGDPFFTFEAQADAGQAPFIDYNVLDSFKKSMKYMRFDYGNYVDKNNNNIPAYCMLERNSEGAYFTDSDTGDLYAYWTIFADGCNTFSEEELKEIKRDESGNIELDEDQTTIAGYDIEEYNDRKVVKVWRTPQFDRWYRRSYMSEDGRISGIAHFESACLTYSSERQSATNLKWSSLNDNCLLVPAGDDGIEILESSNAEDSSGNLVLRFTATITLNPDVYNFNNHHMIALAPPGRRNVTDSYNQIQSMFAERAKDCREDDIECKTNGDE